VALPWFRPEPIQIPLIEGAGPLERLVLYPFGMLVALGALTGVRIATWRAEREGLHPRAVGELGGYQLVVGFTLAHVIDAIFYHWDLVVAQPWFLLELWNGLSSFGGFVGAALGSWLWVRHRRASFRVFADPIAFAFPFGWLFGRLGCFVAHDHPGRVTDFPLAVADYHIRGGVPPWQTRHDLGLYEVFWCLAVIPLFLWLGRRKRAPGFYLALLPLLYAPVRFGLDFLRATDIAAADTRYAGLTPGHYGAIVLALAGLGMIWRIRTGGAPAVPYDMRLPEGGDERYVADVEVPELESEAEPSGAGSPPDPEEE
jgi:phosphatidylglycerol:prolipoprotein diacylglycerol transferase